MLAAILRLINPLAGIAQQIARAHIAKLDAQTERERIEADVQIEQLNARQAVLLAEQSSWFTRLVRPVWAAAFIIFTWKVVVIDTVLGLGTTPHLSPQMYQLMTVVAGSYFLSRGIEQAVKTFKH